MRALFYVIIILPVCLLAFFVFLFGWAFSALFIKDMRVISKLSRMYSKVIIYSSLGWKVKINGMENIQKDKAYIIMSNHQAMLDIPAVNLIEKDMLWVAKKEVLKLPLINFIVLMRKDVLIKRGTLSDSKKMIKKCRKELRKGVSISIFPEGTRSKDGKIHSFKEGAFVVAKLGNTDILPIVIDGPYDITHNNSFLGIKIPATITLNILEPIPFDHFKESPVKDLKDMVEDKMVAYHKTIRPDLY